MVKNEKLICFPSPIKLRLSENFSSDAICICYQHSIVNDYGPYGFDTIHAENILNKIAPTPYSLDTKGLQLKPSNNTYKDGIYFIHYPSRIAEELKAEKIRRLRDKLEKKKITASGSEVIERARLKSLLVGDIDLKEIKNDEISNIFLVRHYSPEGGRCLVFLDSGIISSIKLACASENVIFEERSSIDLLKPW